MPVPRARSAAIFQRSSALSGRARSSEDLRRYTPGLRNQHLNIEQSRAKCSKCSDRDVFDSLFLRDVSQAVLKTQAHPSGAVCAPRDVERRSLTARRQHSAANCALICLCDFLQVSRSAIVVALSDGESRRADALPRQHSNAIKGVVTAPARFALVGLAGAYLVVVRGWMIAMRAPVGFGEFRCEVASDLALYRTTEQSWCHVSRQLDGDSER